MDLKEALRPQKEVVCSTQETVQRPITYSDSRTQMAMIHIEEIRSHKFSVGKETSNPLTSDLHHAVTSLSAELYTKDVHFLMELIQNAEDNEYKESVEPTLEFVLTKEDITGLGSPATLLIFNNEIGFSRKNIESLCSVGCSTKKGKRHQGFIGEKGIGFKSVFLVSSRPHVFSNGYRVRFNEEPDPECGIGYIVPEWVSEKPHLSDIRKGYGSNKELPATTFVLPLKPGKVEAVKAQLTQLHPEILLFLSKVKRLHVRENVCGSRKDRNSIVSISSETNPAESSRKGALRAKGADSRVVRLSVEEGNPNTEENCKYFMWRQSFPVKPESRVGSRADVDQWNITLAFPFGRRLKRNISSVGVFAFLPTAMVTNFPFVIQADFILASSRESILFDNVWNSGIMECVPRAFVDAFQACVQGRSMFSSMGQVFEFLPAQASSYPELEKLRSEISQQVQNLTIVPYDLFDGESRFAKPQEVRRILPEFRDLLSKLKKEGSSLRGLSSLKKILHKSLDNEKYARVFEFLGMGFVNRSLNWYAQCVESCDLAGQASEKLYVELLYFFAENGKMRSREKLLEVPLLRYTNHDEVVSCRSLSDIARGLPTICYAPETELHSWLSKCNAQFGCLSKTFFFLPNGVRVSLFEHGKSSIICHWLSNKARVKSISAFDYGNILFSRVSSKEPNLVVPLSHFLYQAQMRNFIDDYSMYNLCAKVPILDGSGCVKTERRATLVPKTGSKWVKLFGPSNPYIEDKYVDIGDVYAKGGTFLGERTCDRVVVDFLCKYCKAVDLPELCPPDLELRKASSLLSKEQAFLLLEWIRLLRTKGSNIPQKFFASIQNGKWMKTYSGINSPRQSILPDAVGKCLLDLTKHVVVDIQVVDQGFYDNKIDVYQDELRYLGALFAFDDVQKAITARFSELTTSGLGREAALSLFFFIRFLRQRRGFDDEQWLQALKKRKWFKTHQGYDAPDGSLLLHSSIKVDSCLQITNLPIVDEAYYGTVLASLTSELKFLGVVVDQPELSRLIGESASLPMNLPSVSSDCGLLLLKCLRCLGSESASSLIERIRCRPWIKTTCGFKCPLETIIANPMWGFLVKALTIPVIDEDYYGSEMKNFVNELKAIGVAVDTSATMEIIAAKFKSLLPCFGSVPKNVLSALDCVREHSRNFPSGSTELQWLSTEKWLKTRHGYKAPNESIIFSAKWGAISSFVDLPFIDDAFYGISIYKYRDELQKLGVVTDFEAGSALIIEGLKNPIDPEFVTSHGTVALLQCIKSASSRALDRSLFDNFLANIAKSRFLKTVSGFVVPEQCTLYDTKWEIFLRETDIPAIDVKSYEFDISAYKEQLRAIGVKVDSKEVCSLISQLLFSQTETSLIKRLYSFLSRFEWRPEKLEKCNSLVWIPNHDGSLGNWVNSELCVIQDKDDLFGSRLYTLCNYYKPELFPLFSSAFGVRESPNMGDCLQLWNAWGSSTDHQVSYVECQSFWERILKYWNSETEEILRKSLTKVSASAGSDEKKICLVNKEHVFVPDDLRLKEIFSNASVPLFVWIPELTDSSSAFSQKLVETYTLLGVRRVSESVKSTVERNLLSSNPVARSGLIEKGLVKIVLAFLADPRLNMPANERQGLAARLMDLSLHETNLPIKVKHCLAGPKLEAETKKMAFWEIGSGRFWVDKSGYRDRRKDVEFGSCFAREIAEGLLPEGREREAANLRRVIHFGFVYWFEEDAVNHLLLIENLKLFEEDEKFLGAAFSKSELSSIFSRKRNELHVAPSTPSALSKKCRKPCSVSDPVDNKDH